MRHLVRQVRDARHGIVYCRRGLGVPKALALTFDDGPSEWTAPILDACARADARATFFVLGSSIAGNEETLRRAVAEGHELGNHTWSHMDPATLSDGELSGELQRTTAAILDVTGVRPRVFRPPYAESDRRVASVARAAGLEPTVLRSIDPADWREGERCTIVRHIVDRAVRGAIVCLHDGVSPLERAEGAVRDETVAAVADLTVALTARGYRLVTVSELLA